MLKSYLTTAWRNIRKNKAFSAINVIGLSIGMAACLLILQYVNFELSYDQFNKNVGDLYRVYNDRYQNGKLIQHGTITYSAIGKAMQDDYPEVVNHTRVEPYGPVIITKDTKQYGKQQALYVDNSFLTMFSYSLLAGDERVALLEPHTVVITEDAAKRYFGVRGDGVGSVMGKTIVVADDTVPYKVTGISRNVPENSHLQFDVLISYLTMYTGKYPWKESDYDFGDSDFWHYVQLRHGTDYKALEAKFATFSQKHFQGNKVSGSVEKFHLQPLAAAHLYSDFEYEIGKTGSATVVWGLLIIALFIIVIAWVNYINLSTARSVERAREVGVRKVIGAAKTQLVKQFLTESFLINIIALVLSVVMLLLAQPLFNSLVGHRLSLSYLLVKSLGGYSVTIGLAGLLLLGILSGLCIILFSSHTGSERQVQQLQKGDRIAKGACRRAVRHNGRPDHWFFYRLPADPVYEPAGAGPEYKPGGCHRCARAYQWGFFLYDPGEQFFSATEANTWCRGGGGFVESYRRRDEPDL